MSTHLSKIPAPTRGELEVASSPGTLREYRLNRSVGGALGLLTAMDGTQPPADQTPDAATESVSQLVVRLQGQQVELQQLDPEELAYGDQARVRLCVTLVPSGDHTKAELSVQQPRFMEAMVRGDIVPEAVGWCAALAISFCQGLLSGSVEAALVSFGISALGLLAVRIGTAYSVWKRARRCFGRDVSDLLQAVHRRLAPACKDPIARY